MHSGYIPKSDFGYVTSDSGYSTFLAVTLGFEQKKLKQAKGDNVDAALYSYMPLSFKDFFN